MNILFLCVANSARSQMAEGLAKSMLGNKHNIQSAGSIPSGEIHPYAIQAMDDIGIDIRDHNSKSINDLDDHFFNNLDYVITLCAEEACPSLHAKVKILNWGLEDPANKKYSEMEQNILFNKSQKAIYQLLKKFILYNL